MNVSWIENEPSALIIIFGTSIGLYKYNTVSTTVFYTVKKTIQKWLNIHIVEMSPGGLLRAIEAKIQIIFRQIIIFYFMTYRLSPVDL